MHRCRAGLISVEPHEPKNERSSLVGGSVDPEKSRLGPSRPQTPQPQHLLAECCPKGHTTFIMFQSEEFADRVSALPLSSPGRPKSTWRRCRLPCSLARAPATMRTTVRQVELFLRMLMHSRNWCPWLTLTTLLLRAPSKPRSLDSPAPIHRMRRHASDVEDGVCRSGRGGDAGARAVGRKQAAFPAFAAMPL